MRRLIDVFSSGILLLLAAPLLLIGALAIWLTDRGCVLYRQARVGLHGRRFEMLKFRSMRSNNLPLDNDTEIEAGHAMVTPVGRWLRRFKVDELPQLFNVLRGDMALIGPRPTIPEQVEKYTPYQHRRHNIRPGMTGWAQVNGGIALTWPERIMLDVWYIDHRSFWMDVRILWQTAAVVLFGDQRNPKKLQEAVAHANQVQNGESGGKAPVPCRVVHLTSVHPPSDVRIFHKECKSLALAGYDVTLIAPSRESDASRDGVKVCAIRPPRNRFERMTRTAWKVYKAAVRENADIYHFHDPELMPVCALLRRRGKRVIYDVHEDFARDVDFKPWIPALLRGPASLLVRASEFTFTQAFDRVIAATPMIARKFPAGKTRLVQNFPWTNEFRTSNHLPYEQREPIAVYVGGLSDERGLREMRQAVELAAKEIPVRLVIAGKVNPGTRAEFQHDRASSLVEHKGQLGRAQIAEVLGRAKVGLVLLHPTGNYVNAQPNKLFEYMSAGLPVLASDFPLWRKIVGSIKCGLVADPLNPAAIAEALVWLFCHPAQAAEMGRNGQRAVAEKYNWERESKYLIATYAELQPA